MIVEIKLENLKIPQGLLPRVLTGTIPEVVEKYRQMMEDGVEFDPIKVWKKGTEYWIVDGVHRVEAARQAGLTTIKAELVELTDEKHYRLEAIKANLKHGVALQEAEKKVLAQILYEEGMSKDELRKLFGVGEKAITRWLGEKLREKMAELKDKGLSQREIARSLGVNPQTITNWLREREKEQVLLQSSQMSNFEEIRHLGNISQSPQPQISPEVIPEPQEEQIYMGDLRREQMPLETAKEVLEEAKKVLRNPAYEFLSWAHLARGLINMREEWQTYPGFFKIENLLIKNSSVLMREYESVPEPSPELMSQLTYEKVLEVFNELGNKKKIFEYIKSIRDLVENDLIQQGYRVTQLTRDYLWDLIQEHMENLLEEEEISKKREKEKEVKLQDPQELLESYIEQIKLYFVYIIDKFGWETAERVADEILVAIAERDIRDWDAWKYLYVERKIRRPYDRKFLNEKIKEREHE
ncbi:MAG: helix-turn-helix domain-containing protein [candidate division WOR-3 bacterium]